MHRLLKNRHALSTVITTLIILVVSVLLASVVAYYATNVVSTRVQEESLYVSKQHIWVNSDGDAEAAIMVTNNGGRDVVINKLAVRGQASEWSDIFYAVADDTDDLTLDLEYVTAPVAAGNDLGLTQTAIAATKNLVLPSGYTMVIYANSPDSIGLNDIGLTVGISLHSAQAVYYSEVNIEAKT
jgi:FlaG/FlaF family flagellin (archaellin)